LAAQTHGLAAVVPPAAAAQRPSVASGVDAPLLVPHTYGPRDVPRCGALSLLQKPLNYKGG
jgi:hypothetical protein